MASKRSIGESRADKPRRPGKKSAKPTEGVKPGDGQQRQPFAKLKFVASEIVMRDPAELKPFPNNPKIHTPKQVDAIVSNIEAFGFDQPTLIDEHDQILKGHGRHLACVKIGCQIPTIARKGLSDADKWAIVISDNALPAMTGFDNKLLRIGLTQLAKVDFPLHLTGFDKFRLAGFIGPATHAKPDDAGDVQERVVSTRGDVWVLGEHRLMCGDSSNGKTVAKLLGDEEPELMLTDPPYSYAHDRNGGGLYRKPATKQAEQIIEAQIDSFDVNQLPELLTTNIFFTSRDLVPAYIDLAKSRKLKWDLAVLHRQAAIPANNGHLTPDLDYILIIGRQAPQKGLEAAEYSKLFSTGHWERPVPWAKPVALMSRILKLFSAPGGSVFEPYAGSGTTIIAAETCQRRCLALELKPEYVDLAVRRWQTFTKKPAILESNSRTFEQVGRDRAKRTRAA